MSVFDCYMTSSYDFFFFFKQKTAYEMRISDWSSDVCSSDLSAAPRGTDANRRRHRSLPRKCPSLAAWRVRTGYEPAARGQSWLSAARQIGRASCRERVCQYV